MSGELLDVVLVWCYGTLLHLQSIKDHDELWRVWRFCQQKDWITFNFKLNNFFSPDCDRTISSEEAPFISLMIYLPGFHHKLNTGVKDFSRTFSTTFCKLHDQRLSRIREIHDVLVWVWVGSLLDSVNHSKCLKVKCIFKHWPNSKILRSKGANAMPWKCKFML